MVSTREKGDFGEDIAVEYLEKLGYKILKRNFHFGRIGEIDIVAEINDELVFVEVKLRTSSTYGEPIDSITPRKVATLKRVAQGYYHVNSIRDKACRFDVITVDKRTDEPKIEHLKNAIYG
jgi:putative endonuclease